MQKKVQRIKNKELVSSGRGNGLFLVSISLISFAITLVFILALNKKITIKNPFQLNKKNHLDLEKEFLSSDTDQYIDPFVVKKVIDDKNSDWIIVDYRSEEEYTASHIKGAVNIPLYQDYKRAYETQVMMNDWVKQFEKVMSGKKMAVIYGYWQDATMGKKLASFLTKNRMSFRMLAVGFTDFKNNFNRWFKLFE